MVYNILVQWRVTDRAGCCVNSQLPTSSDAKENGQTSSRAKSHLVCTLIPTLLLLALPPLDRVPTISGQRRDMGDSSDYNNRWKPFFFREINERARLAKLKDLRTAVLRNYDLELRLWIGFGPVALKGFVLKRRGSTWSATYLRSINRSVARNDYQKILAGPKSGWEGLWKRLDDNGVLTLPGATESGVQYSTAICFGEKK